LFSVAKGIICSNNSRQKKMPIPSTANDGSINELLNQFNYHKNIFTTSSLEKKMPIPKLIKKTLSAVLDSPILQAFGVGDVYQVLRNHFEITADEMALAYQKSYGYALTAIAAGLASKDKWQRFWQQVTDSRAPRELAEQIVTNYWQPFVNQQGWNDAQSAACRQQTLQACQALFETAAFQFLNVNPDRG
jgi:hypothetical protein